MDEAAFLAKGMILGFSIAAPVGPIGLLCIRRSLEGGMALGLASGLGAATADAFYGAVAAFGIAAVADLLTGHQVALRLVGGIFLIWLGLATMRSRPARGPASAPAVGTLGAFASTAVLTAANPATILSFAAVFGGLGLGTAAGGTGTAAALVAGVFLGSALWWLALSFGVATFRDRMSPAAMAWTNRVSGAVLCGFGVYALSTLAHR